MAYCKNRLFTIIFLLICTFGAFGQQIKLNKEKKIDTLYVCLIQTDKSDLELNNELQTQFNTIIEDFNAKQKTYQILIDSIHSSSSISFTMGPIKYVTTKRNLLTTTLDLAMVGANLLILPYFPPVIPFYLIPATYCRVNTSFTPDLATKSPIISINPSGYFRKKAKQRTMFKKKFNKVFFRLFNEIDRQNFKIKVLIKQ